MEHIHLIGIGGTGLSAIARVLLERGYTVSGSDQNYSPLAEAVDRAGAQVFVGHAPGQIQDAELVIRSSAVPEDNPEVQAARGSGIPVLTRKEFLPRLMTDQQVIAVAGSHGKTTTTAMLAWVLSRLEQDPSFIVGGVVENLGVNARAGDGPHFVIEADEYDYMFLGLRPDLALVTNVEHDHPDMFPSPGDFHQAFVDFIANLDSRGALILCGEDPGARALQLPRPSGQRRYLYGRTKAMDYRVKEPRWVPGEGMSFELVKHSAVGEVFPVKLSLPGLHNVLNAAGALAACDVLGLPLSKAAEALAEFQGSGRRFEILGEYNQVILIDDYGHHPTEIKATLHAARQRFPEQRLWVVWEPHTYSRIKTLVDGFAGAFQEADRLLVTKVYAAREKKPAGFSIQDVMDRIAHPAGEYCRSFRDVLQALESRLRPADVVIVFSAGDAVEINQRLADRLQGNSIPEVS